MKCKLLIVIICLAISSLSIFGQSFQKDANGLTINNPKSINGIIKLKINVQSNNVLQIIATPASEFSIRKSLVVTDKIQKPAIWEAGENQSQIILSTTSIIAKVDKNSLNISFFNKQGQPILNEESKEAQAAKVVNENCYHIKQSFRYKDGEVLYGLGSFQDADIALNGKKIELYQKNREDIVPVIISTNHYGLLWDNYSFSEFNDTKGSFYLWSEVADEINYYFIYGENIDSIVSSYRQLTGKAPMYPKNFYGYIQSKQKYNTQDEIVSVVKGFRDREFPLDVIVQDWMYWPQGQWAKNLSTIRIILILPVW